MRGLAILVIAAALLFLVYHFYFQKMPSTDEGTAPTEAITLTGVRRDLLEIAQAERSYVALHGRCASLEELISSSTLLVPHTERDGYGYAVACASAEFKVTARHPPAPAGSAIRYPQLAIDSSMQITEIN
jgi:hypothetical protein